MREAHERERTVGLAHYVSDTPGLGGRLRETPADFRVREVETVTPEPADADPGAYPHLLVRARLRSWDTNDFARALSNAAGIGRERVSWAGTKDKHAVTTQLFTIRGLTPDEVPTLSDADVTVVGRLGRALAFGDLAGNAFEIRLRDADGDPAGTVAALADWTADGGATRLTTDARVGDDAGSGGDGVSGTDPVTGGEEATGDAGSAADGGSTTVAVPNWFGHQRFGSRRPITHTVGLRLLAGDPRGAVLAYAGSPFETEPVDSQRGRAVVEREAASDDPDWTAAREAVPERLRFERSMLDRLTRPVPDDADLPVPADDPEAPWWFALAAVPENLRRLFVHAAQSVLFNRILSERLARGLPFARPVAGDVVCFTDDTDGVAAPDPDRTQAATEDRLDVLARHCERGRAFVTAPLVGHETTLADGEPGEIERAVLAAAGVAPDDFSLPGVYDSAGTRRAVLVATDLTVEHRDGDPVFGFGLPSGAYATGLLREFAKGSPEAL